jgi:hypothetical protein
MPGWITNGVPPLTAAYGSEQFDTDTIFANGQNPQTASVPIMQLCNMISYFGNGLDKTMVSGTRYYSSYQVGNPQVVTGIAIRVGGTGGTDNWIFELHGPTGLLLATTTTSGTTAGTANTWQKIDLTATYNITVPGTYFVAIQGNGNTAKFDSVNAPATTGLVTGSATGVFGTGASITPPTTYTANLGPKVMLY